MSKPQGAVASMRPEHAARARTVCRTSVKTSMRVAITHQLRSWFQWTVKRTKQSAHRTIYLSDSGTAAIDLNHDAPGGYPAELARDRRDIDQAFEFVRRRA